MRVVSADTPAGQGSAGKSLQLEMGSRRSGE